MHHPDFSVRFNNSGSSQTIPRGQRYHAIHLYLLPEGCGNCHQFPSSHLALAFVLDIHSGIATMEFPLPKFVCFHRRQISQLMTSSRTVFFNMSIGLCINCKHSWLCEQCSTSYITFQGWLSFRLCCTVCHELSITIELSSFCYIFPHFPQEVWRSGGIPKGSISFWTSEQPIDILWYPLIYQCVYRKRQVPEQW